MSVVLICLSLIFSDGDSARCTQLDGSKERIRLAGMDAGEVAPFTRCRNQPGIWACSEPARQSGPVARLRAQELAQDVAVCTSTGRDRYRRVVATCQASGADIGSALVSEGLAISDKQYGDPYRDEERLARQDGKGVWSD